MNILHIITSLENGGTEKTLYKICKHDTSNRHTVISLKNSGKYFSTLKKIGIQVYCLEMKLFSIYQFYNLIKKIHHLKPDVVQTWLPHGDFIGGIASRLAGVNKVVWNIRYSKLKIGVVKLRTIILLNILLKLSYIIPKLIVVVSKSALRNYKNIGYSNHKLRLIQNGYDLSINKFDKKKINFRKKYRIKKNIPIIGSISRYDPTKDHESLLNSLLILKKRKLSFFCVIIGPNINNKHLIEKVKKLKLKNFVKLLGNSNNVLRSLRGLDFHILNSKTEGFPNIVAESMACGTPCVVTDVGDSSIIVGKTGWIVEPNNSSKLANKIEEALREVKKKSWKKRCDQASLRIKNNFGIKKMIDSYNLVWSEVKNNN